MTLGNFFLDVKTVRAGGEVAPYGNGVLQNNLTDLLETRLTILRLPIPDISTPYYYVALIECFCNLKVRRS